MRLWVIGSAHATAYTGTLLMLDQMWYRDYPRSSFHWFNDWDEWKQMDKVAHFTNAYHLSRLSYHSFRWTGLTNHRAALWGSISGSVFLTTVEILDGFSAQWGASAGDLAANTLGSLLFFSQQTAWQQQKIVLKYSFSNSRLHPYRPELLGNNLLENIVKDYNGLTFWLSLNPDALGVTYLKLPPWLNLAIGFGATGMLGGTTNPVPDGTIPFMQRSRQFYLSPDIDYTRIPTQSTTLRHLFTALNFIKFPAPALEYHQHEGFSFHLVFF